MRKEQALYKSRKNTTKGGQRENQVCVCMYEGQSAYVQQPARLNSIVGVENFSQIPIGYFANP